MTIMKLITTMIVTLIWITITITIILMFIYLFYIFNVSPGLDTWKAVIGSQASLQANCSRAGFNLTKNAITGLKPGLALSVTTKMTASLATPELVSVQEVTVITTTTLVGVKLLSIAETKTSK